MKKLAIIGGIVIVLFIGIIVLTNMSNSDKMEDNPYGTDNLDQATIDLLDDENSQNIILPEDLEEKIESGEGVFAYMFSPLCSYCMQFTPKLMAVAEEEGIQVDQLNVFEYEAEWPTYNLEATPTLIYFEDGKEVARIVGDKPQEEVRQFFEGVGK